MRKFLLVFLLVVSVSAGGLVRVEGRCLRDDDGAFLGLGASYFQALRRAKFEPERFEADLKFLSSNGFNYVRALSMVGWFGAWEGREIAPVGFKNREGKSVEAWGDYWEVFGRAIDRVYAHGMRTEITIFADAQLMPGTAERIEHMRRILELIKGREEKVILLEVANEAWQNGFPGKEGVADLREFAKFLGERTEVPVAITSNHEDGVEGALALYKGSAADIATWHFSRDTRGPEGAWLPVRDCLWTREHPELPPFSSNEPIGPGSSVASENDPVKLVMAAAYAWGAGLPMYVYHTSAGVFGREPFEKMAGVTNFAHLRKLLPADLPNWQRTDLFAGMKESDLLVVGKGDSFVALPIGLTNAVALEVKKAVAVRAHHPLAGTAMFSTNLTAGGKLRLPRGEGAFILVGEVP